MWGRPDACKGVTGSGLSVHEAERITERGHLGEMAEQRITCGGELLRCCEVGDGEAAAAGLLRAGAQRFQCILWIGRKLLAEGFVGRSSIL